MFRPSRCTCAGAVGPSSSSIPPRSRSSSASPIGRSNSTSYTLSTSYLGCARRWASSPSFVSSSAPVVASVESTDGNDAHRVVDEPDDRRPTLRVARGRDDTGRLVEEHVGERLLVQRPAVEADVVGRLDERVQLPGLAVDGHSAGLDQLVRLAARRDSRARQPGVQPHPWGGRLLIPADVAPHRGTAVGSAVAQTGVAQTGECT